MAPPLPPGEARPAPKPQPIGSFPFLFLITTATVCGLFIIWRRSDTLRTVVAHQLKTWTRQEGAVRLSEDDGPPAHSFLEDDENQEEMVGEDNEVDGRNGRGSTPRVPPAEPQPQITRIAGLDDAPPAPPPKNRT
ncbi:hypothetical protein F5148DRAFT_1287035 [Russula earlei]|uniref:Uncharacterized protein n=1 Tax=Russula earlei TaxID=71964 RepID=A0ACC0U4F8_9AGAM|nr:hypothetical protein F5148DRAFT_1287035 [Russula earlei]